MKKVCVILFTSLLLLGCNSNNNTNPKEPIDPPVIIPKEDFKDVYFDDMVAFYDGNNHILNEVRGAPEGTDITYTNRKYQSSIGVYTSTATLSKDGYNDLTLTATLKIIRGHLDVLDVDTNKESYKFKENPMWDESFNELLKGNYSLLMYSGSRESLEDPTYLEDNESYTYIASDGVNGFSKSYSSSYNEYNYEYYKVIKDDTVHYEFKNDSLIPEYKNKLPTVAMDETFIKRYVAMAFVALQPAEDGSLISGVDQDDFYGDEGTFEIMPSGIKIKHEHKHGSSYFYEIYQFFNIGNTVLNIPDSLTLTQDEIDALNPYGGDIYIDGVRYGTHLVSTWNSPYVYMAHTYLYYWLTLILEPGVHYVYPAIYNKVVVRVVYSYYSETNIYNLSMSGYELNVCFDKNGVYQGEYKAYGEVTDKTSGFTQHGGLVHYYDEWHN